MSGSVLTDLLWPSAPQQQQQQQQQLGKAWKIQQFINNIVAYVCRKIFLPRWHFEVQSGRKSNNKIHCENFASRSCWPVRAGSFDRALASSGLALTLNGLKIPNRRLVINRRSLAAGDNCAISFAFWLWKILSLCWLAYGHLIRADDDYAQAVPLTALSCLELFQVFSFRSVVD